MSLYQIWFYTFYPGVNIQLSDQFKFKAFSGILHVFGYEMFPEGNGWLVKDSLRLWQFLQSIDDMETYLNEAQARPQSD